MHDLEAKKEEILDALEVHGWLNHTDIQELIGDSPLTREAIYSLETTKRIIFDVDMMKYGISEHEKTKIANQEREEYGN